MSSCGTPRGVVNGREITTHASFSLTRDSPPPDRAAGQCVVSRVAHRGRAPVRGLQANAGVRAKRARSVTTSKWPRVLRLWEEHHRPLTIRLPDRSGG